MPLLRYLVGVVGGLIGCVTWAIGLATFRPAVPEPSPLYQQVGENNSYWDRDLRHLAILLAVAAVLVIAMRPLLALVTAITWAGVDLYLDAQAVHGRTETVIAAVAAFAAWTVLAIVLSRLPVPPDAPGLRFTLAVVGTLIMNAALYLQDPQVIVPRHIALVGLAVSVGYIFVVCTFASGPTARSIVVATVLSTGAAVVIYIRHTNGEIDIPVVGILPMAVTLGVVLWLTGRLPRTWDRQAVTFTLMALLTLPAAAIGFMVGYLVTIPLAEWMTRVGGNPPINAADSDVLGALMFLIAGLFAAYMLHLGTRRNTAAEPQQVGYQR